MNFSFTTLVILIMVISYGAIIISSIKLFRAKNIPGSKLIFLSILIFTAASFIPSIEEASEEYSMAIAGLVFFIISSGMLMGAYGFMLLTNYAIGKNANK